MKERLYLTSNLLLFALAALFLGTLQTSLWFQIFGYFPGPALWIPCLVYIALFHSTLESVIFSYLVGFMLSTMTAMPEGLLMSLCLALSLTAQIFKQRIYWSGSSYFMMTCGFASLIFHIYHWGATFVVGDQSMTSPEISDWLIQSLLTPLVAPLLFPVFQWFDKLTNREHSNDVSARVT